MAEATETALACIREEVERAFSSAPGAVLEAALSRIAPADECARAAAYAAWDSIAHPLGGLGDFEDAVACIAAAQGSAEVAEFPRALATSRWVRCAGERGPRTRSATARRYFLRELVKAMRDRPIANQPITMLHSTMLREAGENGITSRPMMMAQAAIARPMPNLPPGTS